MNLTRTRVIPLAVLMALLLTASFAHGSTVIATFNE